MAETSEPLLDSAQSSTAPAVGQVPFQAHVDLLRLFLVHRDAIVDALQAVLNAEHKSVHYREDRALLARAFEDCLFALEGMPDGAARLRGQLERAHRARGFTPREMPGMFNDIVDPAELMRRVFHLWTQTQWPGRKARVRYAHTLFNVYLLRQLALLCMRVWDAGADSAGDRLAEAQGLLDALWRSSPADQPVLVRDARWLLVVAQSPATEELAPYFEVAERIATSFADGDRVATHDAVARTTGGHLRSYLHYYITQKGVALDDARLVLLTRKSNALDFSLLIHSLVPLLEAYENALHAGAADRRLELADAICQGISSDPDLLVNRVALLGAYSMVEPLFTTEGADGHAAYTPLGQRHVDLLREYAARMTRLAKPLHEDCRRFEPVDGAYSPYGAIYGFTSNLLEHMALKAVQPQAETRFGLEDVFSAGDAAKLAWVNGWRKLPHVDRRVQRLYAYPQQFAEQIFARVERALRQRADDPPSAAVRTGRLFLVSGAAAEASSSIPALPIRYIGSSDEALVAAQKAHSEPEARLASDRQEGHFLLSYTTANGSVVISKDLLTEVLGAGHDARIAGLPAVAAERLRLMCRDLVEG